MANSPLNIDQDPSIPPLESATPPSSITIKTPLLVPRAIKPKVQKARKEALAGIATILCGASIVPEGLNKGVTEMYRGISIAVGQEAQLHHIQQLISLGRHIDQSDAKLELAMKAAIEEKISSAAPPLNKSLRAIEGGIDWQILRKPTQAQLIEWYVELNLPIPGAKVETTNSSTETLTPNQDPVMPPGTEQLVLPSVAPTERPQILINDIDGGRVGLELPKGSEISISENDGELVVRKTRGQTKKR